MLPCVCSVIDHRRRQNVVRTSVTHSTIASCATFLFLPHFDVICDLLLNRSTATWNLFVKYYMPAPGYEFYLQVFNSISYEERSERVRYPVEHEKIKFVSTSGHVIFCLLYKHTNDDIFYDFPKISEDSPKVVQRPDKRFRTFPENFRRLPKISEDNRIYPRKIQ